VIVVPSMDKIMTCAEFQETLPELFEAQADLSAQDHLKTCENCAALVRDLEYIASQARLLLPIHDPSPAVWEHIQKSLREGDEPGAKSASPGRK
jgi:hypothetical protein